MQELLESLLKICDIRTKQIRYFGVIRLKNNPTEYKELLYDFHLDIALYLVCCFLLDGPTFGWARDGG
jgi:hypothetical protein